MYTLKELSMNPIASLFDSDTIVDIDFDAVQDLSTEELEHNMRVELCGKTWGIRIKSPKGFWYRLRFFCGYVNECPICRQRKADKIRREMLNAGLEYLYVYLCSPEEAKELCEQVGTENYRRFPMADGQFTMVYKDEEGVVGKGKRFQEMELDLYDLCVAPKGKRITGKLGKKPAAKKDMTVQVKTINAPTVSDKEWERMTRIVFNKTSHYNPKCEWELQFCLDKRFEYLEDEVKKGGYRYWVTCCTEGVDKEELDWDTEYSPPEKWENEVFDAVVESIKKKGIGRAGVSG